MSKFHYPGCMVKRIFQNVIELGSLRWADYQVLSGWSQYITNFLIRRRQDEVPTGNPIGLSIYT